MKIAIATDTNSGITAMEGEKLGVFVLAMPVNLDETIHYEGIDITSEQLYDAMRQHRDVSTSQPSPGQLMELWDGILAKGYDEIVYIPMSSGLSSSCQTAQMLADDYDGRVQVVNNQRISVTQLQSVMDAKAMAEKGWTAVEIKEELERTKFDSDIYITVDTLKYLKKGGRITPAAAALGTLLRIKPVLIILGEKLDSFAKARTMKQAKTLMMNAIQKELDERLHDSECKDCHLAIAHSDNEEAALEFKKEVEERFPDADIYLAPLSLSIACHIGPGSLALTATRKMEEEHEKN